MAIDGREAGREQPVRLRLGRVELEGELTVPPGARGLVLFAHGSGSSRKSPRNRFVARVIREAGVGTLLFDLLSREEEELDSMDASLRFDIGFLAERLVRATDWALSHPGLRDLRFGYFGSSTGAAAALVAATERPERIRAVVSRGGRPDLAGDALPLVRAPTLLIVGGADAVVIELNQRACRQLRTLTELLIIPGATHLFPEPGALEEVARLAAEWFGAHLAGHRAEQTAPWR
ncbi:MAG TPA: hypothetical protein VK420_20275 [Longimicrobium sp.]|nr:hypothetical protein [Longimicrobium sp.]